MPSPEPRKPRTPPPVTAARQQLQQRWYAEGLHSTRTCISAFGEAAAQHTDQTVVFVNGATESSLSIGDLHRRARSVAAGLQALGVRPGDAVAVQLTNTVDCMVAYQAVLLCGATLVPIVHIYGPREVDQILSDSAAVVIITSECSPLVTGADPQWLPPTVHRVLSGAHRAGWRSFGDLSSSAADYLVPTTHADEVCLIVYTSGSSAAPKGVMHSHNTVLAEQRQLPALIAGRADDVHLVAFPPGHLAGVASMLRPMVSGTATVFTDGWDAARASEIIARFGVTSTAGAPLHLTTLLDEAEPDQLVTLREFLVGAAPVPAALGRRAGEAGIDTFRCYGLSEHPTVTAGRPTDPERVRLATDGAALPGTTVRVIGPDGHSLDTGVDGEICVIGPEQFVGYTDAEQTSQAFTEDGWLRTGDLGHLDTDGCLTVVGRIKEVVIRAGETISARQVEDVLSEHVAVAECAVVAVPDARYGEIVGAAVVLVPGHQLELVDVQRHFRRAGLAVQKTPQQLVVVDDLPRSALGKICKPELAGLFAS
ncbi:cyclohexanecarboxylate-CoA ligase [Mycobacterium eburneum]|nr:AMP-binding protein [Mycobacterium eburneum]TDH48349.1 cyclohexanecarboxylate-CoA ligase [Mycobacterium eburneum]